MFPLVTNPRAAVVLIATVVLAVSGCSQGAAPPRLVDSPPTEIATTGSPLGTASVAPLTTSPRSVTKQEPVVCPPLPATGRAGGRLAFTGSCAFEERRALPCPNTASDADAFHIRFTRRLRNDLTMHIVMTLEGYKGPGSYRGTNRIIIQIFDNSTIYEWSTDTGAMTIDPGARSGSIPRTALAPATGTPTRGTEYVAGSFSCLT